MRNKQSFLILMVLALAALSIFVLLTMSKLTVVREMRGRLEQNGMPVASMSLKRAWHWHLTGEEGFQETVADAGGRFMFPAVERRKPLWAYFPHEPVIQQTVYTMVDGVEVRLFLCSRRRYDRDSSDRCAAADNAPYQLILE